MWVLEGCKCSYLAGHGVSPWTAQTQCHCLPHTGTSQSPAGWPHRSAGGFLWGNVVGRAGEEQHCGARWGWERGCREHRTTNGRSLRRPRFHPAAPWRARQVLEREKSCCEILHRFITSKGWASTTDCTAWSWSSHTWASLNAFSLLFQQPHVCINLVNKTLLFSKQLISDIPSKRDVLHVKHPVFWVTPTHTF